MRETAVTQRYAKALLEAADEQQALSQVSRDVAGLIELIDASEDLRRLLESPMIPPKTKREALESLLKGRTEPLTLNFLLLMVERRRERQAREVLRRFVAFLDEREGLVTANVQSAQALTSEQEEDLSRRLSAYLNRRVRLETRVTPEIRAGFIARAGDTVFDGTIETQLQTLRARMLGIQTHERGGKTLWR